MSARNLTIKTNVASITALEAIVNSIPEKEQEAFKKQAGGGLNAFAHKAEILEGLGDNNVKIFNAVVNAENKFDVIMRDLASKIVSGRVEQLSKEPDQKVVDAGLVAETKYGDWLKVCIAYGVELKLKEANSKLDGVTMDKMIENEKGKSHNLRKWFSFNGCDLFLKHSKYIQTKLSRELNKLVAKKDNGIGKDEVKEVAISFRADDSGELKALAPVERKKPETDFKKQVDTVIAMLGDIESDKYRNMFIKDLLSLAPYGKMINVALEKAAKVDKDLSNKIELIDDVDALKVEQRDLENAIKNNGKGLHKMDEDTVKEAKVFIRQLKAKIKKLEAAKAA